MLGECVADRLARGSISAVRRGVAVQRAAVRRSEPTSTERTQAGPSSSRADDDLRRAAADVADGDDAVAGIRAGDGAGEREPALLLGGDDPHLGGRGPADRVEQALRGRPGGRAP